MQSGIGPGIGLSRPRLCGGRTLCLSLFAFPLLSQPLTPPFPWTPLGEDPPPLGFNFPSSGDDKQRRSGKLPPHAFDTTSTYSFSFHSMFIDFPNWALVSPCGAPPIRQPSVVHNA